MNKEKFQKECVRVEEVASCIYTMHKSGFATIRKAHQNVIEFAEEHGIKLSGKIFEVYNRDMSAEVYYEIAYK